MMLFPYFSSSCSIFFNPTNVNLKTQQISGKSPNCSYPTCCPNNTVIKSSEKMKMKKYREKIILNLWKLSQFINLFYLCESFKKCSTCCKFHGSLSVVIKEIARCSLSKCKANSSCLELCFWESICKECKKI